MSDHEQNDSLSQTQEEPMSLVEKLKMPPEVSEEERRTPVKRSYHQPGRFVRPSMEKRCTDISTMENVNGR